MLKPLIADYLKKYLLWEHDKKVPISITWFRREVSFWFKALPVSRADALRLVSLVRVPENMKSLRYTKQKLVVHNYLICRSIFYLDISIPF